MKSFVVECEMAVRKKAAAKKATVKKTPAKKAPTTPILTAKQLHVQRTLERVRKELEEGPEGPPTKKRRTKLVQIEITDDEGDDNDDDIEELPEPLTPVPKAKRTVKLPAKLTFNAISPKLALSKGPKAIENPPSSPPPPVSYDISTALSLFVNGKPKATPLFERMSRDSLRLDAVWLAFEPHFKRETEPVETLQQLIHCTIKCTGKQVRKQVQIIHDWSTESAEVLLTIMDEKHAEKACNFDLGIEFKVEINLAERSKALKAATISSPGGYEEPSHISNIAGFSRRAVNLAGQRNTAITSAADPLGPTQLLMRDWACNSTGCGNIGNYCYEEPPPSLRHIPLNDEDFEKWVRAIEHGQTSKTAPSLALYKHWITTKGTNGVLRDSERAGQRQTTKDLHNSVQGLQGTVMTGLERLALMQEKQWEVQAIKDAKEESRNARREAKLDKARARRELEEEEREEVEQQEAHRRRLGKRREMVVLPSSSPSQLPHQVRASVMSNPAPEPPTFKALPSSPLRRGELDINMVKEVFDWMIGQIKDPRGVEVWTQAYLIVVENQWKSSYLKKMSIGSGVFFDEGLAAGLPRGLMRQFRDIFAEFKALPL